MRPTRRTFMQTAAAFLSGLLGLEAAEELLDRAKPRKVMVPGVDFGVGYPNEQEHAAALFAGQFLPYRTKNVKSVPGALLQELYVGEPGYWRTGNYVGREGALYGKLLGEKKVPVGCQLGPNAELVGVDEAQKTLKFLLEPEKGEEWRRRYAMSLRKCPPPRGVFDFHEDEPIYDKLVELIKE